jgi:hypothetical protein
MKALTGEDGRRTPERSTHMLSFSSKSEHPVPRKLVKFQGEVTLVDELLQW